MRVLIGHTNLIPELQQRLPLPGRTPHQDDILAFGNGHQQVAYELGMTWPELLAQCPRGWQPDAYLHWSLEYNPVPEGLETADCFTVGIVGDWNLGGQAFQQMGGVFDLLLADKAGGERLRRAGYENVAYARLWAYDPAVHRRMEGVERDLDIVMVGSFNHDVQQERARWLGRLAKLSRKYKICMTQGVYGEEYTRLLNRAKIVFNRSIGGGINMRAYEAPACGALLFYERENPEIREVFADRQECVLYGEDDLEDLLDYYLRHEEERARIAEAGHQKVAAHSYARHLSEILSTVEAAMQEQKPRNRYFLALPAGERLFRHAYQRLLMDPRNLSSAEALLNAAETQLSPGAPRPPNPGEKHATQVWGEKNRPARYDSPQNWGVRGAQHQSWGGWGASTPYQDILSMRACLLARFAECLPAASTERQEALQQAARSVRRALELQPDYAVGWFNLAQIHFALSNIVVATDALRKMIALLEDTDFPADRLRGPYHAAQFQAFAVGLEEVWANHQAGTESWAAALYPVLLWRAWEQLSDVAFEAGRYVEALESAAQASVLRPEISGTRYRRARALRLLGRLAEAEREYRRALDSTPLYPQVWAEMMQMFLDSKQWEKGRVLLEQVELALRACPCYEPFRPTLEAFTTMLAQNAAADAPRILCLLALPDWNDPAQWQLLLREYVLSFGSEEQVSLLLLVDPKAHPPVETIIARVAHFLEVALQTTLEAVPDVTLWPCTRVGESRVLQLPAVDALVRLRGQADVELSVTLRLPLFSPEQLSRARLLLAEQ